MTKLTKAFRAVPPGEIYPIEYQAGDECPSEHEESARAQGCIDAAPAKAKAPKGGASSSGSKAR